MVEVLVIAFIFKRLKLSGVLNSYMFPGNFPFIVSFDIEAKIKMVEFKGSNNDYLKKSRLSHAKAYEYLWSQKPKNYIAEPCATANGVACHESCSEQHAPRQATPSLSFKVRQKMSYSSNTKITDILFCCPSLIVAYITGVAIAAGEMRYMSISWRDAFLWPINALMWFSIIPLALLFFLLLVGVVLSAWHAKRSRLPFRLGMGILCFSFVMWFMLTLGFHD